MIQLWNPKITYLFNELNISENSLSKKEEKKTN